MKIASLEDDRTQSELIRHIVTSAGFECASFGDGGALRRSLRSETYDLLLVDWQLPDISGREIVIWVRSHFGTQLPIIFVTARALEEDVVAGLSAGADDYMVKPIRKAELLARIHVLLRRAYPAAHVSEKNVEIGPYRLDSNTKQVSLDGQAVELTPKEFALAELLFKNVGQLLPRDVVVQTVWGRDVGELSRTLDTHFSRLRTKLALRPENGVRLSSVYSHGYRLEAIPVSQALA
jgi:DNA-binding response OmpR family regulator